MFGTRTLLTGPHGAAVRDRVLSDPGTGPAGLWIVRSPLARLQVLAILGRKADAARGLRVWCWDDLWEQVAQAVENPPTRISPAAVRTVVSEAINRARKDGKLKELVGVIHLGGFRRRVAKHLSLAVRAERDPNGPAPSDGDAAEDYWAIYRHYTELLRSLGAVDAEGFISWASSKLAAVPGSMLADDEPVTVFDLAHETRSTRRAMAFFEAQGRAIRVTSAFDPDPALSEVFGRADRLCRTLRSRRYDEKLHVHETWRAPGLRAVESELFRDESRFAQRIIDVEGLRLLGAPQGEGVGLLVAREVKRLLESDNVAPEDILVLARRWDDEAEQVMNVLRSWHLPVAPVGRSRALARAPEIAALLLIIRLEREGWEADDLVGLLRHGQFRPNWPEAQGDGCVRAAFAVQATRLFRGSEQIQRRLERAIDLEPKDGERSRYLAQTRALVDRVVNEVSALHPDGTRRDHAARLERAAGALGLGLKDRRALETLWEALADQAAVLEGLRKSEEVVSFEVFADEVSSLVHAINLVEEPVPPGTVVFATLDEAAGARARFVFLVNLSEGTFPSREAVESGEHDGYAREMFHFLSVLGAADEGVFLVYPTRDDKGQEVLAAGFVDELRRRLDPKALAAIEETHARFDPTLSEHPDLAVATADARVRAVALACAGDRTELTRLAADPRHRPALEGTAAALSLEYERSFRIRRFTPYEGAIEDPAVISALSGSFGANQPMSATQLETYLECPFKFFMSAVLGIKPIDENDELKEDRSGFGWRVHKVLEEVERRRAKRFLELDPIRYCSELRAELTVETETDPGRQEIENRRLEKTLRRYEAQAEQYVSDGGNAVPVPRHFEVRFGVENGIPHLVLGEGSDAVKIGGTIDRVDILPGKDADAFRVIDYKTGSVPKPKEVEGLSALQLPLYAWAAERLRILGGDRNTLADVGYWDLKERGFSPIELDDWPAFRERLETKVLEIARRIRRGEFVVESLDKNCTRYCDFRGVCRVRQVRNAGKTRASDGVPEESKTP
jgi:RecB family exonuclease